MDKSLDKKGLIQKISNPKVIIKKITNHNNGDATIRIGKEEKVKSKTNQPGEPTSSQVAPLWFVEFNAKLDKKFENIDKKFENLDKKLDDHIRDFDAFKLKQDTFNKKLLECPTIAAEFRK